jgi:hypothetical protein
LNGTYEKLFEDGYVVEQGVLFEGFSLLALPVLEGLDAGIDCPDGERRVIGEESSPGQEREEELVGSSCADTTGCPSLGKKLGDEPSIHLADLFIIQIPGNDAICVPKTGGKRAILG